MRRGRWKTLCARGAVRAWSRGPSTSPLDRGLTHVARLLGRSGGTAYGPRFENGYLPRPRPCCGEALVYRHAWCGSILRDRKSTRLNSSHRCISYAVFCLKKKKEHKIYHSLQLHNSHQANLSTTHKYQHIHNYTKIYISTNYAITISTARYNNHVVIHT